MLQWKPYRQRVGHSPILVSLEPQSQYKSKSFKFEAYWLDDVEFLQIVAEGWMSNFQGSSVSIFHQKLKCKDLLSVWSKSKFKNATVEILKLESKHC